MEVTDARRVPEATSRHLKNSIVWTRASLPDKWEYPWYAAWDLAFHAVALSTVDVDREVIGRGVIRLMATQLDGEQAMQQLEIGVSLVEGETVGSLG